MKLNSIQLCLVALMVAACASQLAPNLMAQTTDYRAWSDNVIVPQCYRLSNPHNRHVVVEKVTADILIDEQIATTTLNIYLQNQSSSRQTAEVLIPVPQNVAVTGFDFLGKGRTGSAELLSARVARQAFNEIVSRLKDPALLEFAGSNLIRSSVFPVEPNGKQQVKVVYEQVLKSVDGTRVDYELPRSGNVTYSTPWEINLQLKSKSSIAAVYSPSHQITTVATGKKLIKASVVESSAREPGPFYLSYLLKKKGVTASMFAYPDADAKGGYFLLLSSAGTERLEIEETTQREVTLVIDRSGSMRGEKMEQAQEAAKQVLYGLEMGESFNIIAYNNQVESFAENPVKKTKQSVKEAADYIDSLIARDGTNIYDALQTALVQEPGEGVLPIVMFLTDGLATEGNTNEADIRKLATESNEHSRRLFTFGVGYDVNTPLLDKLARSTRAFSTFVMPNEDVETKVSLVFKGLDGPTLTTPELFAVNKQGEQSRRVSDILPGELPDLYDGDQLIVLGRYRGNKPLKMVLQGQQGSKDRKFELEFKLPKRQTVKNAFVGRLWASRRIAGLIDQIRDMGGESQAQQVSGRHHQAGGIGAGTEVASTRIDPRLKEITDEIISLSTEFGIITEYTSFLAEEGTDLADSEKVLQQAAGNLKDRAMNTRGGLASVSQEFNNKFQREQSWGNKCNIYICADGSLASVYNVQQCRVGSYYKRNGRWVGNNMLKSEKQIEPDQTVEFGSAEFLEIAWKLVEQERQDTLALDGDVIIEIDGQHILVKQPEAVDSAKNSGDSQSSKQSKR